MPAKRLFGTNGIRGVVNSEITPEFALKMGMAVGTFFRGGEVFLGQDGRTSSPMLAQSTASGLMSTGCIVYDVGLAPTPAIQYAVKNSKSKGAIIITASHNPPEYNGIKVIDSDGVEIPREKEVKIEEIYYEGGFRLVEWRHVGRIVKRIGVLEAYKEGVKRLVDIEAIKGAHLRVVADLANGVGALVVPYLLRELGCEVTTINAQIDGTFPGRMPEPRPEYLGNLSTTVKALKADLGVAYDGDADRSLFVDEKGIVQWGDKTGAIIANYVLEKNPGATIVTPISSSRLIEEIARRHRARLVWTTVGSIMVSRTMQREKSIVSFEENGGLFYGPHQPVRDGAMATALMLEILAKMGKTLSEMVEELPKFFIAKKTVKCPDDIKQRVLEKLLETTKERERITIDGVKLIFKDGSVLVRPSGTEPIYRIYAEGETRERADELADLGVELVEKALKDL